MFDYKVYNSPFTTTFRNEFFYWLRNLVLFPAYLLPIYLLLKGISEKVPGLYWVHPSLSIILSCLALLMVTLDFEWHMGFSRSFRPVVTSLLVTITLVWFHKNESLTPFLALFSGALIWGTIQLLHQWQLKLAGLSLAISLSSILFPVFPQQTINPQLVIIIIYLVIIIFLT